MKKDLNQKLTYITDWNNMPNVDVGYNIPSLFCVLSTATCWMTDFIF